MTPTTTEKRIMRDARKIVRGEMIADLINDPKQFLHRRSVGYYSDRLIFASRWLVNDEQQQIDEYFSKQNDQ